MNQRAAIKNDILISIQPEYANQIMDGCKTVELRRRFVETIDRDTRLFIYSSISDEPYRRLKRLLSVGFRI
jgi:hypothetical protein